MTQEEIWQRVGEITTNYSLLECKECAVAIAQWLEGRGQVYGTILRIQARGVGKFFILSNRYGDNESITRNGKHYGVEVIGKVFDNLSIQGLPREEWISDFSCPSGQFTVEEVSLSSLTSIEEPS